MASAKQILYYLKTSRPGLWFATIWLYMLPTSQTPELTESVAFWFGLFYVCFPMNFLVYGWNDAVDYDTDKLNPRKDSFWFGARGSKEQLLTIWKPITIVQLLTLPLLIWFGGITVVFIYVAFIVINGAYNLTKSGLRGRPPLELICQVGYLLVVPLSIAVNELNELPWQTYLYLFLFAIQSHLIGEVMDIEPDRSAGRKTTATVLGLVRTKWLITLIVAAETLLLTVVFDEFIFGGMLGLGVIWMLLDILVIYKDRMYTEKEMRLLAKSSNLIALASISYVWYSGCLIF